MDFLTWIQFVNINKIFRSKTHSTLDNCVNFTTVLQLYIWGTLCHVYITSDVPQSSVYHNGFIWGICTTLWSMALYMKYFSYLVNSFTSMHESVRLVSNHTVILTNRGEKKKKISKTKPQKCLKCEHLSTPAMYYTGLCLCSQSCSWVFFQSLTGTML